MRYRCIAAKCGYWDWDAEQFPEEYQVAIDFV